MRLALKNNMVNLNYKIEGNQYYYCTYRESRYTSREKPFYCLEINKGKIGTISNFDPLVTENYKEIEEEIEKIRKEYPDPQPETIKIKLIIDIRESLQKQTTGSYYEKVLHLWKAVQFVTLYSGLGTFALEPPKSTIKPNNEKFELEFYVIDKDLFYKVFIEEMSVPLGITDEMIKIQNLDSSNINGK